MPVPKRKRSKSRRDKRFANKFLKVKAFSLCKTCNEVASPHQVCASCGFYRGRKVLVTKDERTVKRQATRKEVAEKVSARSSAEGQKEE